MFEKVVDIVHFGMTVTNEQQVDADIYRITLGPEMIGTSATKFFGIDESISKVLDVYINSPYCIYLGHLASYSLA